MEQRLTQEQARELGRWWAASGAIEHYKVGQGAKGLVAQLGLVVFATLVGIIIGATWHEEILALLRSM